MRPRETLALEFADFVRKTRGRALWHARNRFAEAHPRVVAIRLGRDSFGRVSLHVQIDGIPREFTEAVPPVFHPLLNDTPNKETSQS